MIDHAYGEEPEKKYIREMIAPPTMVGLAFGKIPEGKNGFKRSSQQILGPSMTMRYVSDGWIDQTTQMMTCGVTFKRQEKRQRIGLPTKGRRYTE